MTTVTNTFFSFGIFSTIYHIEIYNILYREIFSSKVLMMQPNTYGTNIFWWCSKKSVTSVDKCDDEKNGPSLVWNNCNICRQCILKEERNFIPKQTETSCDQNNIWDKYFLMIQQKKRDKCDDETKRATLVGNNWNICRQCILKEKKNFIAKQTETNCDQNNIWDKYFLMIQQKKCDKSRQVWRWKKLAHPWSETTVTFVDNVF